MTVNTDKEKFKLSTNKNIIDKPDKPTAPGWMNSEFTPNELIQHIASGFAFSQGVIKSNKLNGHKPSASDIEEAWLVPVDVDNDGKVYAGGKYISRKLSESEGYFSFDEAIRDPWLKEHALLIYTTPSHTEEQHRFRIVFLLEEPIKSAEEYTRISTALIDKFGSDKSCKNIDRLFYGNTNAEVFTYGNSFDTKEIEILTNKVSKISEINADLTRTGEITITSNDIAEMLSHIPTQPGYQEWLRILSAVGNYLNDDNLTTQLIDAWSADIKNGTITKVRNRLKQPNISTLLYFAKLHGMNTTKFFANSKSNTVVTSTGDIQSSGSLKIEADGLMKKLIFLPYTDMGNAERIVARFGDKIRYNFTNGNYYIYNGRYWERDEVSRIYKFAKKTVRAIEEEAPFVNSDFRKLITKHSKSSEARGKLESMLALAKQEEKIACKQSEFDKNLYLFNCENMVYDLKTNEAYPHKPEMMLSKCAPVVFDPDAVCYAFESFIEEIFDGDYELIKFVQRALGVSLCGDHLVESLFFACGSGKNGKSVFFRVIEMILGDYYQNAPAGMLLQNKFQKDNPTDVARLPNARFVIASELPENGYLNESKVKDLTGGDTITARFLYQNEFSFKPTHTLWIFGNHKPKIRGTDNGIWRRINLIPFNVTIADDKQRPQAELLHDFELEKSGILNWILKGWQDFQQNQNKLNPPEIVTKATEDYRNEEDKLGDFIQECCKLGVEYKIEFKVLFSTYNEFCKKNEEYSMKKLQFRNALLNKNIKAEHGNGNKVYLLGIGLNNAINNVPEVF